MKIRETDIKGVVVLEPVLHRDHRGYFCESFREDLFRERVCDTKFVMDCESMSRYGVVRGLHYQSGPFAQGKLVRVVEGAVLDVAVDIRKGSPTFGRHVAVELTGDNHRQLFVPRGFAHGFAVLSPVARVQYKCDNYYSPDNVRSIKFDDPDLNIDWLIPGPECVLSEKDLNAACFAGACYFDYNNGLY